MGVLLKVLGRLNEAITQYQKVIEIEPNHAEAHYYLGIAFNEIGRLEEAAAHYRTAIGINPNHANAHNNLGIWLQEIGRLDEAVVHCLKAIAIEPEFAKAHYNLGNAFLELEQFNKAVSSFEKALTNRPDYDKAHSNLGVALMELERFADASAHFRNAVMIKPQNELYWVNWANCVADITFTAVDETLFDDLLRLLEQPTISPRLITQSLVGALRHQPEFAELLRRANSIEGEFPAFREAAKQLSSIPLLLRIMALGFFNDLEVERLLTSLRRCMILEPRSDNRTDAEEVLPFSTALALHCFANEYIFPETSQETAAVERLSEDIADLMAGGRDVSPALVVALAAYRPLYQLSWAEDLLERKWPDEFMTVIARQLREPLEEISLRNQISSLPRIRRAVSMAVRDQYEENPYPRWVKGNMLAEPRTIREVLELTPLKIDLGGYVSPESPDILVAGCGTGQHALSVASHFSNSTVLGVDLSFASLSYAIRKTRELGFTNIEYAQADIMELGGLGRRFDLIECGGVLHHLEDPLSGWRVLLDLLRPGGLMKIALYSETARRCVALGRELIATKGYTATAEDIRRCRQDILAAAADGNPDMMKLIYFNDFYSLSECRDLLFHAQEHRFTIPQIEATLRDLGLKFLGFELNDQRTKAHFKKVSPEKAALTSLSLWHKFELDNPDTFRGMYQFWCQKS